MSSKSNIIESEQAKIMIKNFMTENNIEFVHLYLFLEENNIICIPREEYDKLELVE